MYSDEIKICPQEPKYDPSGIGWHSSTLQIYVPGCQALRHIQGTEPGTAWRECEKSKPVLIVDTICAGETTNIDIFSQQIISSPSPPPLLSEKETSCTLSH